MNEYICEYELILALPTSGKFCNAKALAMLWSSVQLMASAIANTPRQFAAVSCFSGDGDRKERQKPKETETETIRLINTETNNVVQTFMTGLSRGMTANVQFVSPEQTKTQ